MSPPILTLHTFLKRTQHLNIQMNKFVLFHVNLFVFQIKIIRIFSIKDQKNINCL